ncbi:hypothetical protein GIB67_038106 [Kingdonia uniflora]|uniref:3'-5' exonuclease domain-containing protein n=1 Tax=Kingdonia uniflora TaxID=39325 RepID=A0A7J7P8D3_9MAGN|nr:hypothetical protein GIB67_038106 [Kingdonia uniflora]
MVTARQQSRESRIRMNMEELRIKFFGYQPLHLPTPILVSPTYHHMSYEEVMEAGDDYYQMVCFYYLLTSEEERQNGLRLLAKEAVITEDEAASIRPRESCWYPARSIWSVLEGSFSLIKLIMGISIIEAMEVDSEESSLKMKALALEELSNGPLSSSIAKLSGSLRGIPSDEDFHFFYNFQEFKAPIRKISEKSELMLKSISLTSLWAKPLNLPEDSEDAYDWLVNINDEVFERFDVSVDEFQRSRKEKNGDTERGMDSENGFQLIYGKKKKKGVDGVVCNIEKDVGSPSSVKMVSKDEKTTGSRPRVPFHIPTIRRSQDEFNILVNNSNEAFQHVWLEKSEDGTRFIHPLVFPLSKEGSPTTISPLIDKIRARASNWSDFWRDCCGGDVALIHTVEVDSEIYRHCYAKLNSIIGDRGWNAHILISEFLADFDIDLNNIVVNTALTDKRIWRHHPQGTFTVNSAFEWLINIFDFKSSPNNIKDALEMGNNLSPYLKDLWRSAVIYLLHLIWLARNSIIFERVMINLNKIKALPKLVVIARDHYGVLSVLIKGLGIINSFEAECNAILDALEWAHNNLWGIFFGLKLTQRQQSMPLLLIMFLGSKELNGAPSRTYLLLSDSGGKEISQLIMPPKKGTLWLEKLLAAEFIDRTIGATEQLKPLPLECTPFKLVEEVKELKQLAAKLCCVDEFAVDLEHNQYRSFQGITCLMQISTRTEDFVVDTLKLRVHIGPYLRDLFKDPSKIKVMHGADRDIVWLQRDFGIYVCNLFDTGQASRVLHLERNSLEYLLHHFCGVTANKEYQNADWRLRPIPDEMLKYAREDTHYLLHIYDLMRGSLLTASSVSENGDDLLLELSLLSRRRGEDDRMVCIDCAKGFLFVKTFYKALDNPTHNTPLTFPAKKLHSQVALLAFFAWTLVLNKALTIDNLRKRKVLIVNFCSMCKKDGDSIDYLFLLTHLSIWMNYLPGLAFRGRI